MLAAYFEDVETYSGQVGRQPSFGRGMAPHHVYLVTCKCVLMEVT